MNQNNNYTYTPLPEPTPIIEQQWPEGTLPLVTTRTITYMHEPFIRECIESILMQKTTFPVEVVIHDDASTDKTADIVREYAAKHPRLIKAICQKENQFSKPGRGTMRADLNNATRGKYIALCEGDDYWTDPLKLQKQVEFLEGNEGYVMCYHDSQIIDESGLLIKNSKLSDRFKKDASEDDLKKGFKITTQSMLFRNVIKEYPPESTIAFGGDKFLTSMLGHYGKGKYLECVTPARFRIHSKGINRGVTNQKQASINHLKTRIALFLYYERIGDTHIRDYFLQEISRLTNEISGRKRSFIKLFIPPIVFSFFKFAKRDK